ncbi:MAG TPA: tRNA uridine(34) hydroxylase [Microbacteriaceae bacterium]
MAIPKILLYYVFTPLADPDAVRVWQRDLCESLGLRGRILISRDGINGTIGGDLKAVKHYLRGTRSYPPFTNLDVKWSEGTGFVEVNPRELSTPMRRSGWLQRTAEGNALLSADFPRLSVKVRDEIVSFGAPDELRVDATGVLGGGIRLKPDERHTLVAERGEEVAFFDARNSFEAEIGHFTSAIVPNVANTREFVAALDSGAFDHLKDRPVVTYCTGGIRCEVLSGLMQNRGFGEVYQLDGGIARYGEAFGDDGLWEGALYVFDNRISMDFSDHTTIVGHCTRCGTSTKRMQSCADASCRIQLVVCTSCADAAPALCAQHASA